MPWNAVLNTFDFFTDEMVGYNPATVYPFAVNILVTVAQVVNVILGKRVDYSQKLIPCFIGSAVIMIALPFLTILPDGANFWAVFFALFIFGYMSGTIQGTIFTMAGAMPFRYIAMVMFGNGICALGCNAIRGITLLVFPVVSGAADAEKNEFLAALTFYIVAAVIMLACAVLQVFIAKNDFAVYYLDWNKNPRYSPSSARAFEENEAYGISLSPLSLKKQMSIAREPKEETLSTYFPAAKRNFETTQGLLYALMLVFIITFVVFPGVSNYSYYTFLD